MIVGIGVDVVRIDRVGELLSRHGRRARERLFTARELEQCDARTDCEQCLAARLAAKEAALKALGTGKARGYRWTDLEITRGEGCPQLRFSGAAQARAESLGAQRAWVSLTHEAGVACAIVVLEKSS